MQTANIQEEWVRILGKGMITIPKSFREELGFKEGDVARVKKIGRKIIIEPKNPIPIRIYTDKEIKEFLKADKLPPEFARKAAKFWKDLK